MFKWIGAFVGFMVRGGIGAVIGYLAGMALDAIFGKRTRIHFSSAGGAFNPFESGPTRVSQGDFELSLLSLSSLIIKADGEVSQKELDYVRMFFVQQFGKIRANTAFRTFNEKVKSTGIDANRVCASIRPRTTPQMRVQILHFLFGVADADGKIMDSELNLLRQIAHYLGIGSYDFESIKAMFVKSADDAYKILEIEPEASEVEIKKAYRKMVKKYHPDRLTGMDEAYRKNAEEKFNKVQEAYDKIKKQRGFV